MIDQKRPMADTWCGVMMLELPQVNKNALEKGNIIHKTSIFRGITVNEKPAKSSKFNSRLVVIFGLLGGLFFSTFAHAERLSLSGLKNQIDSNEARIVELEAKYVANFQDYLPPTGIKEFLESSSSPVACAIVRHEITRTDNANDSDIAIREILTNGFINCAINDYDFKLTANALSLVGFKNQSMSTRIVLDMPGDVLNDSMVVGQSFGFVTANIFDPTQMALQTSTVLGVENISVPAGHFTDCLKIQTVLQSNLITPNYQGVSWHCPNVGEVQRRYYDSDANNYVTRRLVSIQ